MKRTTFHLILIILLAGCASPGVDVAPLHTETGVDPESWATIPAGEFLMGQHDRVNQVDYDYEIMVTNVTNAQFPDYLNEALATGKIKNRRRRDCRLLLRR